MSLVAAILPLFNDGGNECWADVRFRLRAEAETDSLQHSVLPAIGNDAQWFERPLLMGEASAGLTALLGKEGIPSLVPTAACMLVIRLPWRASARWPQLLGRHVGNL